jgi:hypothetical protein
MMLWMADDANTFSLPRYYAALHEAKRSGGVSHDDYVLS